MRYSDQKRTEIDQDARAKVREEKGGSEDFGEQVQQAKLELLMAKDPSVASLY